MAGLRLLLRLFSLLALVLNGASPAGAASHGAMASAAEQGGRVATAGHPAGACHPRDMAADEVRIPAAHPDTPGDNGDPVQAPCCDRAACGCTCVSCPSAVLPPAVADGAVRMLGARSGFLALAHAAPPLPHLIRPPIG